MTPVNEEYDSSHQHAKSFTWHLFLDTAIIHVQLTLPPVYLQYDRFLSCIGPNFHWFPWLWESVAAPTATAAFTHTLSQVGPPPIPAMVQCYHTADLERLDRPSPPPNAELRKPDTFRSAQIVESWLNKNQHQYRDRSSSMKVYDLLAFKSKHIVYDLK